MTHFVVLISSMTNKFKKMTANGAFSKLGNVIIILYLFTLQHKEVRCSLEGERGIQALGS